MLNKKIVLFSMVMFLLGATGAVLSINEINYYSDHEFGSTGQVFQIATTVDTGTDRVNLYDFDGLYVDQDELSDETDDSQAISNIEIRTENLNTWADYPIFDHSGETPHTIELREFDLGHLESHHYDRGLTSVQITDEGKDYLTSEGMDRGCIDASNDGQWDGVYHLRIGVLNVGVDAFCATEGESLADSIGRMQSPEEKFEFDLVADNNVGQVCRETFSNNDVGTGGSEIMCNNMIQAQFQGSAGVGTNPPWTDNELVMHSNDWSETDGLRVTDRSQYERWNSYMEQSLENDIRDYYYEQDELIPEQRANTRAREAVSWQDDGIWGNRDRLEFRDGSLSDGNIALESWEGSDELLFPIMTILVEAGPNSFAVLEQVSGEPEITDITEVEVGEADSTSFDVTVENIGDNEGEFEVRSDGCTRGSVVTSAKTVNLDVGETSTLDFLVSDLSTGTEEEISGECEFVATDTSSQETSSISGDFTLVQDQHCTPNSEFRSFEDGEWTIKECDSSGLDSTIVERCGDEAVAQTVDDELQCVSQGEPIQPPTSECEWYDINCKIANITIGQLINGTVVLSGFVIGFLLGGYAIYAILGALGIKYAVVGGLASGLIAAGVAIINPYIIIILILLLVIGFLVRGNEFR